MEPFLRFVMYQQDTIKKIPSKSIANTSEHFLSFLVMKQLNAG